MKTIKVNNIDHVSVTLLGGNASSLEIVAKATNANNNYSNIRLEPHIYITPPQDGIWEFDMVGEVPPITDGIIDHVAASYKWENFPKKVKGVKVYGNRNSKTTMLPKSKPVKPGSSKDIEVIKAEAWVNTQPLQPTKGGTLIVSLDYNSNNHGFHNLQPAVPQGINPKVLLLQLTDSGTMIFIQNPRHNNYSQGLSSSNQYTSIDIIYEGNIVASINSIPIIS